MEQNELYPIFLKVAQLNVLIVGGGNVGLEKLTFLLKSSPNAKVTIVSIDFNDELVELAKKHNVLLIESAYNASFLDWQHIVVATTDNIDVNVQVYHDCKDKNILVK